MIAMWTPSIFFFLLIGGFVAFIIFSINLFKKNPKLAAILVALPFISIMTIFLGIMPLRVFHNVSNNYPPEITGIAPIAPPIVTSHSESTSPIWSEGIENEFEADIYPSKESAVNSVAKKLAKESQNLSIDWEQIEFINIYRGSSEVELAEILRDTILNQYPGIECKINEPGEMPENNAIRITLNVTNGKNKYVDGVFLSASGSFQAIIFYQGISRVINIAYNEKPWIEDFSSYVNSYPGRNYIIAKSNETCMSPNEAERQAMQNVLSNIIPMLSHYLNINNLQYNDIQRSGMIVDKFVQSFDTSTGKIWREAILLDVSHAKLTRLANIISNTNREKSMDWARTTLSIVGLFVLIVIVYAFLNAATKGYYSSSLKIIGIILAAAFLFIILKFVQ